MRHYLVYGLYRADSKLEHIQDGLFYVGITSDIGQRVKSHKYCKKNKLKLDYIKKYGLQVVVFWDGLKKDDAVKREDFLLKWFGFIWDDTGMLTNKQRSSNHVLYGNMHPKSNETKKRMSTAAVKRSKRLEYQIKQRDSHLTMPYATIMKMLDEWSDSMEISSKRIRDKYGVYSVKFGQWVKRYRPDLEGHSLKNKIRHVEAWRKTSLSKHAYAKQNGLSPSSFNKWVIKYEDN